MSLGPINPGNFDGFLKVAAAVTAASAISGKYADIGETDLGKFFSGSVWNTNLVISMVTGGASAVVYNVGSAAFDAAKLTAVLWIATAVMGLQASGWDVGTLKDNKMQTGVAAVAGYLAFA